MHKLTSHKTHPSEAGVNLIVRAVIIHDHHILLAHPTSENSDFSHLLYFLPGGHVDHNEPTAVALKREIWEEMNLSVIDMNLIGSLECSWNRKGSIYHEVNFLYHTHINDLSLSQPPRSIDSGFLTFSSVPIKNLDNIVILPHRLKNILVDNLTVQKKNSSKANKRYFMALK